MDRGSPGGMVTIAKPRAGSSRQPLRTRLCTCNAFVVVFCAPISTLLALVSLAVLLLDQVNDGNLTKALAVYPLRFLRSPWQWHRLISYVVAHNNFSHAWSNLTTVLLLGPALEERYG